MIGLVIVSHSRKLAEALVELLKGTGNGSIPVVAAGGVGEEFAEFGTDASDIVNAITTVYSDDGVLVLTDLGSSVLSAELALDFLPDEQKTHIKISSAPLVEGAISAAVQIGLGSSLADVGREAAEGLLPKQEQLDQPDAASGTEQPVGEKPPVVTAENHVERILTVNTVHGLHARPATKLIQLLGTFDAVVQISNLSKKRGPVTGKSLNRLLSLNILQHEQMLVSASGPQAQALIEAVSALVEDNFGETEESPSAAETLSLQKPTGGGITGISGGIAIGQACILTRRSPDVEKSFAADREKEKQYFQTAVAKVSASITDRKRKLAFTIPGRELGIFDAHLILLKDPELYDETLKLIDDKGYTAAYAWTVRIQTVGKMYELMDDVYLKQRAQDVRDIGAQVSDALSGRNTAEKLILPAGDGTPFILFSDNLTPTQTASLDGTAVAGIVTQYGGPTSHAAILCRALGIPAVSGFAAMNTVTDGQTVIVDGTKGEVLLDPGETFLSAARNAMNNRTERLNGLRAKAIEPAVTADNIRIVVFANIASPAEAEDAVRNGAEGVGLFRTEFLFLDRKTAPSEEEQYKAFVKLGSAFGERPVIIRTFDIGGDKQLDYMNLPDETNPFLGVRGVRLYEKNEELFIAHIRAILRAAISHDFRIMIPMISEADECIRGRQWIEQIHIDMNREGIIHQWPVQIGAMIETPAAAVLTGTLARYADFFSIGSNDLTQYVMAAERGNPYLVHFADPLHPAVLSVIQQAIEGAHQKGKQISVCGEMGSDREGIIALVGLGIDEISLTSAGIPEAKELIRSLHQSGLAGLIPALAEKKSAAEMRAFVKKLLPQI